MQKFSIKDLSRIETQIDEEMCFAETRMRQQLRQSQDSREVATEVAKTAILAGRNKFEALLSAKFAIRALKQVFNVEKGINDKTLQIALLTARNKFVENRLASLDPVSGSVDYHSRETKYQPGITTVEQDKYRAEVRSLQRQIQRLKDSCAGINSQGIIELDRESYAALVDAGLVDA